MAAMNDKPMTAEEVLAILSMREMPEVRTAVAELVRRNGELTTALERGRDTFRDLDKTLTLLGRGVLAQACKIAADDARDVLTGSDGRQQEADAPCTFPPACNSGLQTCDVCGLTRIEPA